MFLPLCYMRILYKIHNVDSEMHSRLTILQSGHLANCLWLEFGLGGPCENYTAQTQCAEADLNKTSITFQKTTAA